MNNCGLTRTDFYYARFARLAICVVVALSAIVAKAKNLYNDWAQQNAVNLNAPAAQNTSGQNPSAPMLQRIKQESQSCGQVIVQLMQRPLNADIMGSARAATGGTAAHVQVVAIDKSTGKVVDNFGVTGDFSGGGKARIFSEKDLGKYYSKPCGTYEMSSEDYYAAKARTIKQIEGGAIYEPYSGVGLADMAKVGAEVGAQVVAPLGSIASVAGAVAGAVGGAMAANDIYETRRHDYGIHSDSNAKMSFPIVNCQAGGDMFVTNLEGLPTVVTVEKYVQPGEKSAKPDERKDEAKCDIDTSKLESLLKERINMLEQFIAKVENGKQLDEHDKSRYEGNVKESLLELQRIDKQIVSLDVPDDKHREIGVRTIGKVKSLLDKVVELEAKLEKLAKKSDDVTCQCANPRPYAFNGQSSIPGWANCENCGRQVGVTLNGKIISTNPLTKGKEPRWVTWEEANKISKRFKKE